MWDLCAAGVTFFFIVSAFLLMRKHPFDTISPREYRNFVFGHAARLYPLNWLALALMILLALTFHSTTVDWCNAALTALLLHSWSPQHDMHYGINPVAWFSCVLMFCYVVYPLLAYVTRRWRWYHLGIAIILMTSIPAAILPGLDIPGREAIYVNPLAHVIDFTMGIMVFRIYTLLKPRFQAVGFARATLIDVALLLLFGLVILIRNKTTWVKPWEDVIIWLVPQGAILLAMALLNGQEGFFGRILKWQPLQWLGSISFEVYMLQFVAFLLYNYVVAPAAGHFDIMAYGYKLIGVWLVLLPLAWLVNRYFSRPLMAFFKSKFQNNN